jgi:predicted chitinase
MAEKKIIKKFEFLNKKFVEELRSRGMDDNYIKNIALLAQSEGGGKRESLYYTTAERLWDVKHDNQYFAGLTREQGIEKIKRDGLLRDEQKFANVFYQNHPQLGNKEEGDGWKFRGRTFVQLTGRYNYEYIGKKLGVDLVSDPDVLERDPDLARRAGIEYILWRDPKLKKGATPEGMYRIIGPSTPFSETMKNAGEILTEGQLNFFINQNESIRELEEAAKKKAEVTPQQAISGFIKTPKLPLAAKDWTTSYAYPVDKVLQTKMGLDILSGTNDYMKDAPKSQRDWMVNKLIFDPFDNSSLETQVEKQLSQRNNNTQLGK